MVDTEVVAEIRLRKAADCMVFDRVKKHRSKNETRAVVEFGIVFEMPIAALREAAYRAAQKTVLAVWYLASP